MAEIVELRQERMLPEYEQMRRRKLFSDEEIRAIIKTRESFEYKIERQAKSIKDFCEYIAYERSLISMIGERTKGRNMVQKKGNVEHSIANHIRSLYKQALSRFPEDIRLWDNFIKFCKYAKFISEVSACFEKMIQFHGDKSGVWLRAVMWEYNETHNMDRVKDLLLRGLQRHSDNQDLYLTFFKIMLTEASLMSDELVFENNTQSEQSLGLDRVVVVYESSKKKIHNVEFLIQLLDITQPFKFAKSLEKRIVEDMMSAFPREESMWDALAQRELKGAHMSNLKEPMDVDTERVSSESGTEGTSNQSMDIKLPMKKTLKRRIELCVEVYEAAVQELKTEKIWSLYINAMLELNQDMSTQQVLKRKMLSAAFKGAHEANCMCENHYLQYIELLMESDTPEEYILSVMQKATSLHYGSVKLWELWMRYHIIHDQEKKVYEVFRKATKKLAFEAHPLWKLLLQFYQTQAEMTQKVDEIFREAINNNSPVFAQFKPQYIEWVALTKSMPAARRVYNELVQIPPPCLELHKKMSCLEAMQLKPDIKAWRKCHEYATHFFGKQQTDVWINYIKFERDYGDPKNISGLCERAKATLNADLVDNFISEHSFLITGVF